MLVIKEGVHKIVVKVSVFMIAKFTVLKTGKDLYSFE